MYVLTVCYVAPGGKKPRVFTSVSEFLSSALEELRR